jgi:hypothetical protein
MLYIYIKNLLGIVIPLVLINIFLQYFYKTSLLSVLSWWGENFSSIDNKPFYFIGLFFSLLILYIAVGSIIQPISLAFNGETHNMIYAGNSNENSSILYHEKDLKLEPVAYTHFSSPALTFKAIYSITKFSRDKGTNDIGAPTEMYSFKNSFLFLWITFACLPIMFAVGHAFAYPVLADCELNNFHRLDMKSAFENVFSTHGFTIKRLAIFSGSLLCSLFVLLPLLGGIGTNLDKSKCLALPIQIKPGHKLNAIPVNSFREITKRSSNTSSHMSDHDTGFRYTTFKFEEEFQVPVYVAYRYHYKYCPDFEALSRKYIDQEIPMQLQILDDLSIQPIR